MRKLVLLLLATILCNINSLEAFGLTDTACPYVSDRMTSTIPSDSALMNIAPYYDPTYDNALTDQESSDLDIVIANSCDEYSPVATNAMSRACAQFCMSTFPSDYQRCMKFCNFGEKHTCKQLLDECNSWKIRDPGMYRSCMNYYNKACKKKKGVSLADDTLVN